MDTKSDRVSQPSAYRGYTEAMYDGYAMSAEYIALRDGTRVAIDVFRQTLDGVPASEPLPVLSSTRPTIAAITWVRSALILPIVG